MVLPQLLPSVALDSRQSVARMTGGVSIVTILLHVSIIIMVFECSDKQNKQLAGSGEPPVFPVNSTSFTIVHTLQINLPKVRPANISIKVL